MITGHDLPDPDEHARRIREMLDSPRRSPQPSHPMRDIVMTALLLYVAGCVASLM